MPPEALQDMPSSNAFREIDDTGQGDPKSHKCVFLRKKVSKNGDHLGRSKSEYAGACYMEKDVLFILVFIKTYLYRVVGGLHNQMR